MKSRLLLAAMAASAAALAFPAGAPAQPPAAVERDWSQIVVATPEGGFRMGNPAAPVKLVEYLSLTCPHCASFAAEALPRLIGEYVRSGRVSLEYRNYVLDGYDEAAALLSRCAAPGDYFELNHAILARQEEWLAPLDALDEAQQRQLAALPPLEGIRRMVSLSRLDSIAAAHGIDAAEARSCLADQAALDRINEIGLAAERNGIHGTPSFSINGRVARGVHDWATLEPLLRPEQ